MGDGQRKEMRDAGRTHSIYISQFAVANSQARKRIVTFRRAAEMPYRKRERDLEAIARKAT